MIARLSSATAWSNRAHSSSGPRRPVPGRSSYGGWAFGPRDRPPHQAGGVSVLPRRLLARAASASCRIRDREAGIGQRGLWAASRRPLLPGLAHGAHDLGAIAVALAIALVAVRARPAWPTDSPPQKSSALGPPSVARASGAGAGSPPRAGGRSPTADPYAPADPKRRQRALVDPVADRLLVVLEELGDLRDGQG